MSTKAGEVHDVIAMLHAGAHVEPALATTLAEGLRRHGTVATFGLAVEVTTSELSIESFFPPTPHPGCLLPLSPPLSPIVRPQEVSPSDPVG